MKKLVAVGGFDSRRVGLAEVRIGSLSTVALMTTTLIVFLNFGAQSIVGQDASNLSGDESWQESPTIKNILTVQAKAWNSGDLEKFMMTYWNSDKLTFCSGGKTTYGWQATLDNYRKSYGTPEKMGHLKFDGLKISMIESRSALVLGKWHLKMADDSTRNGNFTLIVKKIGNDWKIIHDHSSSLDPD